jgi:hypothetical protein
VLESKEVLVERDIEERDSAADDGSEAEFFMPSPSDLDFADHVEDYPETWHETTKAGIRRCGSGTDSLQGLRGGF